MDDLDIVCVDIGKDWKRLSRGMGLDESRIDQIQQDYHISGQYEVLFFPCLIIFYPLPDDRILDWSKLKQIADDI